MQIFYTGSVFVLRISCLGDRHCHPSIYKLSRLRIEPLTISKKLTSSLDLWMMSSEPSSNAADFGICDAILMLPVDLRCKITEPLIRLTDTGDSLQAAKLKMLTDDRIEEQEDRKSSLQRNASSNSKGQSRESKSVNSSRRSDLGSTTEEYDGLEPLVQNRTPAQKSTGESANEGKTHSDEQPNEKEKDWQNPFAVTCSKIFNEPEGLLMAVIDIQELLTRLLLAVLAAEHKKPTTSYKKALYQVNMYLEASVRYLASLGITNRAVFWVSRRMASEVLS
ncbi:hypothetical protein ARMSODRAFT_296167 [Armillaria solidipes]|uniref:Uncharacterized protein n=1 Tax=Armillaria solidipes TaxID=1076256 RepID=A0A2H3BSV2_9AGAR|nr:hypothetical protein ARMSODRAFT_296167 [Armillaria solidipes]